MKKSVPLVAIAVLILLGGGAFLLMNRSSSTPIVPSSTTGTSTSPSSNETSLKDLLMGGVAQKCAVVDKINNVNISGMTYLSNGKMRGDYTSIVSGKAMMTHMIIDGQTNYTWIDGQTDGLKMMMDPKTLEVKETTAPRQQQPVDVNKMIDYKCSPWTADPTLFTPPKDVQFSEFSKMMTPSGVKLPPGAGQTNCSACDNLTGDDQAQCKTALKCS